ncbi:MAG: hypothetical protein OXL33_05840, partial [Chloroflexota bacterium]|nr:hypothetical protein [Chloroflexota bacterium]
IAGHERRIEREVIARARQLSAHLAAGENLYRSIHQLAGSRDSPVEVAFGKVADEFRFDRPLAQVLGAAGRPPPLSPRGVVGEGICPHCRAGGPGPAAAAGGQILA